MYCISGFVILITLLEKWTRPIPTVHPTPPYVSGHSKAGGWFEAMFMRTSRRRLAESRWIRCRWQYALLPSGQPDCEWLCSCLSLPHQHLVTINGCIDLRLNFIGWDQLKTSLRTDQAVRLLVKQVTQPHHDAESVYSRRYCQ
jgi:hypothetical protein